MSAQPQASWSLRTDTVTSVTSPCCLTISQSEDRARADHVPCDTAPPPQLLAFKKALLKPFRELEAFQGKSHLVSLHGPAINLSLLHTLTFQFVWPHCTSGTWTCVNIICGQQELQEMVPAIRQWPQVRSSHNLQRTSALRVFSKYIFQVFNLGNFPSLYIFSCYPTSLPWSSRWKWSHLLEK